MSMLTRIPFTKSKHNSEVENQADDYDWNGYEVRADHIDDYPYPDSFHGYVPDIVARKNGHTTLVEVETEDSVDSKRDKKQKRAFSRWASGKNTRHFKRIVV